MEVTFVNDLLSALEDRELPLLSWGVTTGALSEDEVLDTINDVLHEHAKAPRHLSFDAVLQHLLDKALLYRIPNQRNPRYRTRMAESLRLMANLRQLFAPRWSEQPTDQWWQHGRRLVADYRLHVAPRKYPRRNMPIDEARTALSTMPGWDGQQDQVLDALAAGRDLARFQVDACRTIFGAIEAEQSAGVLISAGTGSGKTLAAYLPAFASMVGHTRRGVHTAAIYPRVELLRDQLAEAVRNAARLRDVMGRPLRVGVLYGDTPRTATDAYQFSGNQNQGAWRRVGHGGKDFRCPFMPCPACGMAELVWPHVDRTAPTPRERLRCASCGHEIKAVEVALTRDSLTERPPDLLFTTTEMLNRNSAAPEYAKLLGWRAGYGPAVVLLDEVHTYVGMHGAQVALLLRRWRHAARTPSTFVGLSATLRDGERFFASLTGLPASRVSSVTPEEAHLEQEGREYAIALRGDPVSGASLLSTSIQTAMLFGRVLDAERYLFGTTGFVFTDDLDVTNRLYDDLRDAEGHQNRRMFTRGRRTVLAALRSSHRPDASSRDRDGQLWHLVENIGHHLAEDLQGEHLRIGRTSSQDTGANRNADLIVASPSLEVGVDDPQVGLIIQHKAPRDAAAFIQRRGRAGRARETRPISVVVLSEYGRDRIAYQAYETLFSPELTAPNLPIGNRFVQKIQATQALLDWLGIQVRPQLDPRVVLRAPRNGDRSAVGRKQRDAANRAVASVLRQVLEDAGRQDDLARHLGYALRLDPEEIQGILWEQPRSLMLSVIPTALRRLESGWRPLREDPGAVPNTLLPEFLTSTLFNPLNVPEVEFILPFESKPESLEIAHALREAVPGRVSKRYGYRRDNDRSWIAPPPNGSHELDLLSFVDNGLPEGEWRPFDGEPVTVVRPLRLHLAAPPPEVRTQSQGIPRWGSDIVLPDNVELNPADIPDPSPWRGRLASVGFAAHVSSNPVEVRRMALGAECAIQYEGNTNEDRRQISYTLHGRPAALGFRLDTDGIRVEINAPDLTTPETQEFLASPQWRTLAFQDAVRTAPALGDITNGFQRDWLAQIYLTAFAMTGATGISGAQTHAQLANGSWRDDLHAILTVMYRGGEHPTNTATTDRLVARLSGLAANQTVVDALNTAGELLVRPDIGATTAPLAQRVYTSTLAAALSATAIRACPHARDRDLMVDVLPGAAAAEADVLWLTETSVGGVGVIEYLIQYYAADPRAFWTLVETTLAPGEHEYVDGAMVRLLREVRDDPNGAAAQAIARLRTAGSAADADTALHDLRAAWAAFDSAPRRSAIATLSTRLLRPGSTAESDATALRMIEAWTELEATLGVEVDARVVAYLAGERRLGTSSNGGWALDLTADQAFSLLWPRGQQARNQHLHHYQPYAEPVPIERLLVAAVHADRVHQIDLGTPDWVREYQTALATHAQVDLVSHGANQVMADALIRVPSVPVDRDVLRLYGEIRAVTRYADRTSIRVEVREAVQ